MQDIREALLHKILGRENAPGLSPLVVKLVEMASSEEAGMGDLAQVIEKDAGLTTRLLSLVNSPAFRTSHAEITSISRAVVIMGLREIRLMALGLSLRDTLPLSKGSLDYYVFWRASLHRAVLAQLTASRLALACGEEAFVASLLLEMGLPILLQALEPEQAAGFPGLEAPLSRQLAWEREHLGLDHREVGSLLLGRWGLPEVFGHCMCLCGEAAGDGTPLVAEVVDFARQATESLFSPQVKLTSIHVQAQRCFGLEAEAVNQILALALAEVGRAAQMLDIKLDQTQDLLAVMEQANQALLRISQEIGPHVARMTQAGEDPGAGTRQDLRRQEETVVNTLQAVAHEIRNPLMSVGGFARRLAKQLEGESAAQKYVQVILAEAGRLDQVLAEMTALAAPFQPHPEPLDMGELLQRVARSLVDRPPEHLESPLPEVALQPWDQPVRLEADQEGLQRAFRYMVGYTAFLQSLAGQRGALRLYLRRGTAKATISVFGRGRPLDRDDAALASKAFGPELGLAQARRVVEAHGGDLVLRAVPAEEGFLLSARLPLGPEA
ncbi:MAG: HDOD domain-containing protein [Deltaproteobacteria bacterium]|nr:HDOD domain-containing protein [Deltaproteobacteria bacterium]